VNSYDVRIFSIWVRKDRPKPYTVRWETSGQRHRKAFRTRGLADSYRSQLMQAARRGEPFEMDGGLPPSMREAGAAVTWYEHAVRYVDVKWPKAAGKTRSAIADALATATAVLVTSDGGRPDATVLRRALISWAFNPRHRTSDKPDEIAAALKWVEKNSIALDVLNDPAERPRLTRAALTACFTRMDGKPAAATTGRRKRAVLYNAFGYALELGALTANPLDAIQWKSPHIAEVVDRRVVASPEQVRQLLAAVTYAGRRNGPQLRAFFALLYFAALRPSEALALRKQDCQLPEKGWGKLLLESSQPEAGKAWTDDGERTEKRALKWRGHRETRAVPIPPELVTILREHLEQFGAATDGRLFRTALGGHFARSAYDRAWHRARGYAFPPEVQASPLAARPYDLRHGGVSLWLNAGVPPSEVARRAGHSVDVLLKIYAGCIDGTEADENARIDDALSGDGASATLRMDEP
jgi:integrase